MKPPERNEYPKVFPTGLNSFIWVVDKGAGFVHDARLLPIGPAVWDGQWHLLPEPEAKP
jgi:hypothetical protein